MARSYESIINLLKSDDEGWDPDQKKILELKTDNNYVVEGGPGAGKTLLAIKKSMEMDNGNKRILHLMYNRPLSYFVKEIIETIGMTGDVEVLTYCSWAIGLSREIGVGHPWNGDQTDWDRFEEMTRSVGKLYSVIITDESQDFPPSLLRALCNISVSVIGFIDPHQAVEEYKTDVNDVLQALNTNEIYRLSYNHRCSKAIMESARSFLTGKKRYVIGTNKRGNYPTMVYTGGHSDPFVIKDKFMIRFAMNHKEESVGVIANSKNLNRLYDMFRSNGINVQIYKARGRDNIDFTTPGVKLVSFGTMKGLEFDHVIIPNTEYVRSTGDRTRDFNRMYVAMTRAAKNVYMLYADSSSKDKWVSALKHIEENSPLFDWCSV